MKKILILISLLFFSVTILHPQYKDTSYTEPDNIDVKLFRAINNSRTEILDNIISITDVSILPVSVITPVSLFTISRINNDAYDENSAVLLTFSTLTSSAITLGLKNIIKRERPYVTLKNVNHKEKDKKFLDTYSFPSGHTSTAFAMATSLSLRYSGKPLLIAGLFSYSTLVAVGRIYIGVHYPSDVLGGIIIGSSSAIMIHSLRRNIITFKNSFLSENGKPDMNNNNRIIVPLVLGSFIISDILDNIILSKKDEVNVNVFSTGEENHIKISIKF